MLAHPCGSKSVHNYSRAIARLGAEAGLEMPANQLLTRLMKAKEQRQIKLADTLRIV